MALTITEALAEIKTIGKRMEKRREGIIPYLARQDGVRDPLEKDGGSVAFVAAERQAVMDLGERIVVLRRGIQKANDETSITLGGQTRTISEWLTWRREVAPQRADFFGRLVGQINAVRDQAKKQGVNVAAPGTAQQPADFIVNINERELSAEVDGMSEILGALDGQLSLKNATVTIKD